MKPPKKPPRNISVWVREDGRWQCVVDGLVEFAHFDEEKVTRYAVYRAGTHKLHPEARDALAARSVGYPLPKHWRFTEQ